MVITRVILCECKSRDGKYVGARAERESELLRTEKDVQRSPNRRGMTSG